MEKYTGEKTGGYSTTGEKTGKICIIQDKIERDILYRRKNRDYK
jgi:hypothetical protein